MEIKVFAGTNLGYIPTKAELDKIGGLTAGVCYLPDTIEKLFNEDPQKTKKREGMIKTSGHKSPFDHAVLNLELIDIPKIVAMILNNEQMYTTSEKSARYKRMALPDDENELYEKWLQIFEEKIKLLREDEKGSEVWLTDTKIKKLAQENARYLTSVFTPTSMVYTMSYRQLNIMYRKIAKEIDYLENKQDPFSKQLRDSLVDFNTQLESLGYIDEKLSLDDKNFVLKLFNRSGREIKEQFGESYTITYNASFAQLAQAQRHRTIDYSILMGKNNDTITNHFTALKNGKEFYDAMLPHMMKPYAFSQGYFYIPPILKQYGSDTEWLKDCLKLAEKIPQGMMIPVMERGTIENFILKTKERNCSCAQLEIDNQTTESKKKIYEQLKNEDSELAKELSPYMKGSRCTFPNYECPTPCGFKSGVKGERII